VTPAESIPAQPPAPVSRIEYVPSDLFRTIDLAEVFPVAAPLEVDLGCGDGSFLVAMARAHPERNFIGTERLFGRVRNTCRKAERAGLTNLRILRIESAYVVKHLLPRGSVSRFYVMFPDPWPKRRHWSRRLIQPAFLDDAATALAPGGELCVKTDDADYFDYIRKTAAACEKLASGPWEESVPQTDFERHYAAQGRPFYRLSLTHG
jgi:tRNA (guanine-N7-)-methyltransferase